MAGEQLEKDNAYEEMAIEFLKNCGIQSDPGLTGKESYGQVLEIQKASLLIPTETVSYTHLTLPTILLV